jgi:hypothetical protein
MVKSYWPFFLLFLLSCGKPLPHLEGVDLPRWQTDKNGCSGHRAASIDALTRQCESLKALSEMQIVDLFGKPDQNELYKRNQKFYTYFLNPSARCPTPADTVRKLVIRFNAMGLAKEVLVE